MCILVYVVSGGINLWLHSHTHTGSVTFSFMNIALNVGCVCLCGLDPFCFLSEPPKA